MTNKRLINIKHLYGADNNSIRKGQSMAEAPSIDEAYLDIEDDRIANFGQMDELSGSFDGELIDVKNKSILPTYVDCHTHLVFAESREQEFEDRLNGMTYHEIAERGGGILNSAAKLALKSEEELFADAMKRLDSLIKNGTGAIEIKSGYGLSLETELKMLRVIDRIKKLNLIPVKSTFLGAHAIPARFKDEPEKYLDEVVHVMMPKVAELELADYVDIFCENGYFELAETRQVLEAANRLGLKSRIHVNQFNSIGGIELASELGTISVEHLEVLTDADLNVLQETNMFAVALPGCSLFLRIPYTPARKLIDGGVPFVLASDFNPGSAPTGNLNLAFSLACLNMQMTPAEAFNALTINAAHSLEVQEEVGSIAVGKRANLIVTKPNLGLASIPYNYGDSSIDQVWLNGSLYNSMYK